jgi:DNA-binding HxlR family transcriptional regulator
MAQLRLKRLAALGLITRVRDYHLPSRHRITLCWGPDVPAPPARDKPAPVWGEAAAAARLTELGRELRKARSEVARLTERLRRQDEELRRLRGAPPEAP